MIDGPGWFAYGVSALVVGIPALFGLIAIVGGLRRWATAGKLSSEGARVSARIVDNQQESMSDGRMIFRPVVRFHAVNGQEVKTVVDDPSDRTFLTETTMEIAYDPERPERAIRAGARTAGGGGAIVVGVIFLGFALVAFLMVRSMLAEFASVGF